MHDGQDKGDRQNTRKQKVREEALFAELWWFIYFFHLFSSHPSYLWILGKGWGPAAECVQVKFSTCLPWFFFFFFSQNVLVHVEYLSFLSVWAVVFLISPRFPLLNDSPCVITARDGWCTSSAFLGSKWFWNSYYILNLHSILMRCSSIDKAKVCVLFYFFPLVLCKMGLIEFNVSHHCVYLPCCFSLGVFFIFYSKKLVAKVNQR